MNTRLPSMHPLDMRPLHAGTQRPPQQIPQRPSQHIPQRSSQVLNPFTVLGLHSSCNDPNLVKAAYQSRILQCKPDARGRLCTPEFEQVQNAYTHVLRILDKRKESVLSAPPQRTREAMVSREAAVPRQPGQQQMHVTTRDAQRLGDNTRTRGPEPQSLNPKIPWTGNQWNSREYRRGLLWGDDLDPEAFEREAMERKPMDKYTMDGLPPPKAMFGNRHGNKKFDRDTFNALFELAKAKSGPIEEAPERIEDVQALDAGMEDLATPVVEYNGIMLTKTPQANGQRFVDLKRVQKELEHSVVLSLDEVSQEDIHKIIREHQQGLCVLSESDQRALVQKWQANASAAPTQAMPRTLVEGERLLMNERMQRIRQEEEEAKQLIDQSMHFYPQFTREAYHLGTLEKTRSLH